MPELPEVECLTRAVRQVLEGGRLVQADFRRKDLRTPIPVAEFKRILEGEVIEEVFRRSKYMLIRSRKGYGVFHLGMTGNILELPTAKAVAPHTHAVFKITGPSGEEKYLHFIDPRRFGRIDCIASSSATTAASMSGTTAAASKSSTTSAAGKSGTNRARSSTKSKSTSTKAELPANGTYAEHALFADLGPEPLDHQDLGAHLYAVSRGKKMTVKPFIMAANVVVGVGNIYASESLYRAGISPKRQAGRVTRANYDILAAEIQRTLRAAIAAGGTTFRNFKKPDGNPGYFAVSLNVYDRSGEKCFGCNATIRQVRQSGRSTFYCPVCQL